MKNDMPPIDAAYAITPFWLLIIRQFDAREIHPCAVVGYDGVVGDVIQNPNGHLKPAFAGSEHGAMRR
jgi:hypothetical protein